MRKTILSAASLAALVTSSLPATVFAEDGDEEGYLTEPVVFAQRRLVMAAGQIRPDASIYFAQFGADSDTFIGINALVDWAPIEKLQVGALAVPLLLSPDAEYGDPMLYARYLLLDGNFQLAVEGGYTFSNLGDDEEGGSPGAIHLGVPLRYALNPAARLDFRPVLVLNLPPSGGDLVADLNLGLSLGVSLTRNIYIDVTTGLAIPDFDFDLASIPLGLEVGYSLEGNENAAFIDIYLSAGFDAFLLPNAPEGADALNLDVWTIALGGRFHFALE